MNVDKSASMEAATVVDVATTRALKAIKKLQIVFQICGLYVDPDCKGRYIHAVYCTVITLVSGIVTGQLAAGTVANVGPMREVKMQWVVFSLTMFINTLVFNLQSK